MNMTHISHVGNYISSGIRTAFLAMTMTLAWISMLSCSASDGLVDDNDYQFKVQLDKPLRVLVLGNSFSVDGLTYLDELVKAADINLHQYGIFNGKINGGGFEEWIETYRKNTPFKFDRASGKLWMTDYGSLKDVLSQDWDVIVLMQSSSKSYQWESFEPYVGTMIEILREHCTNPDMRLAYAIPWAHTEASAPKEINGNIACAKRLVEDYGFDVIIPVGVAIQNARQTSLNNDTYLTRDNWHLSFGVGRYIAACTWFESLLTPRTGLSIVGNTANHPLSSSERSGNGAVAVDESNRLMCQKCAYYAVVNPFEVSSITE